MSGEIELNPSVPLGERGSRFICYICGPTVYDNAHIGHARVYIMMDILRNWLEYHDCTITIGMNITDIDDKIIKRASEQEISTKELTQRYTQSFFDDMKSLNISPPERIKLASDDDTIDMIKTMIKDFIDAGYAYVSNGSVYMNVPKSETLIGKAPFTPKTTEYTENEYVGEKKNKKDFVLWKASKEGEPTWEFPEVGHGRPGWHIECSAMVKLMFCKDKPKTAIDLHLGGIDLKFPHHNNEHIQSVVHNHIHKDENINTWGNVNPINNHFCDQFIHFGHLHINGHKMSKSEKNFITIKEALTKYSASAIRIMFLLHKATAPMEYSMEVMENAKNISQRFEDFWTALDNILVDPKTEERIINNDEDIEFDIQFTKLRAEFHMMIVSFEYIPTCIQMLYEFISTVHGYMANDPNANIIRKLKKFYEHIFDVFGLQYKEQTSSHELELLNVIQKIRGDIRTAAKKDKSLYALSDKIRDEYIKDIGIQINDK
jgi:cysteinyl-tRNA synthetase